MPNNVEKVTPGARALGGMIKKLLSKLKQSGCLAQAFIFMASLVAFVATISLILWFLVTFLVPFQIYSRETQRLVLSNGQTLQVKYPNMILGDDKSVYITMVLYGKSNGDLAEFMIEIPPGLIVRKPATQEYSRNLNITVSGPGSDIDPEEIKIGVANSRSEHGLNLPLYKRVVITSPQMRYPEPIDIGVETVPWIAARTIVNNPANEKNAIILLITGFLSGAGTLILQYVNKQRDQDREDRGKWKSEFCEQWKDNPVDTLDGFSRLQRDETEDSDFSMKKSLVETFGWEDKLQQIILEFLKSRNHYFDAKRAADVLYAVCDVFSSHDQVNNFHLSRSLSPFCNLICEHNRKSYDLKDEEAQCLRDVNRRWPALKPLVLDMLHDFASKRENLPVITKFFASEEEGKLLRDANIHDIIQEHRKEIPDVAATAIYEILIQDIHWRETGLGRERKLSDKVLRWLFSCFSEELVDTDFKLGSEYAELEDRSKQSTIEFPVFGKIKNHDAVIVFGGEGTGKTTSALWLLDQYTKSSQADIFPVYAPYENGVELKDWIVGMIARALINFIADNPRKFITSPDSQKTAMGRLMFWHTRNLQALRFNLYSSSVNSNTSDIEQVVEYIRKFKPPKSAAKMTKDEMLSSLYLACPTGFEQICFLWDLPASSPHEDVVNKIKEMAELAVSLSRQKVIVKIFAPTSMKDDLIYYLGSIRHVGDLIWGDEELKNLLNSRMKDRFDTLWDSTSINDPSGNLIREAKASPRRLVKLLLRLMDYVDGRAIQDNERLNKNDFDQALTGL